MILALAGLKGGTGRTTLAVALAAEAKRRGRRALLVDLCPQRCASSWARAGRERAPVCLALDDPRPVRELGFGFDVVVLDLPACERALRATVPLADLVLLPTSSGPRELAVASRTVELLAALDAAGRAAVVFNRVDPRRARDREPGRRSARLAPYALPSAVHERLAHVEAFEAGVHLPSAEPGTAGAEELIALYDEVADRGLASPALAPLQ